MFLLFMLKFHYLFQNGVFKLWRKFLQNAVLRCLAGFLVLDLWTNIFS